MSTQTFTDVSGLVDGAFDEMECCARTEAVPHSGGKVAYYSSHAGKPCLEGFLCEGHLKHFVDSYRPMAARIFAEWGEVLCDGCGHRAASVDAFAKVYPL